MHKNESKFFERQEKNMSGQDASRGFIYQAFASIIEALTQDNWDGITVEVATPNDKVDIALLNGAA